MVVSNKKKISKSKKSLRSKKSLKNRTRKMKGGSKEMKGMMPPGPNVPKAEKRMRGVPNTVKAAKAAKAKAHIEVHAAAASSKNKPTASAKAAADAWRTKVGIPSQLAKTGELLPYSSKEMKNAAKLLQEEYSSQQKAAAAAAKVKQELIAPKELYPPISSFGTRTSNSPYALPAGYEKFSKLGIPVSRGPNESSTNSKPFKSLKGMFSRSTSRTNITPRVIRPNPLPQKIIPGNLYQESVTEVKGENPKHTAVKAFEQRLKEAQLAKEASTNKPASVLSGDPSRLSAFERKLPLVQDEVQRAQRAKEEAERQAYRNSKKTEEFGFKEGPGIGENVKFVNENE
jgi:hypothetical protein